MALAALASCARRETAVAQGNRTGILHVGNGAEPQSLDPHLAGGTVDHNVLSALYEGLVTLDERTFAPRPGAAERWEISADGLRYTFHLRRGAQWSNGDALTARDWMFSFRRALSPALGSEYKDALFPVKNAEDFARGTGMNALAAARGLRMPRTPSISCCSRWSRDCPLCARIFISNTMKERDAQGLQAARKAAST